MRFLSLPFSLLSVPSPSPPPPQNQLGDLGEHCKLSQRGPGQSPGRKRFFGISRSQKTCLLATIFSYFCADKMSMETEKMHVI